MQTKEKTETPIIEEAQEASLTTIPDARAEAPETRQEKRAREALQSNLRLPQTLLAYTAGRISGASLSRPYYIGLTQEHLIIQPENTQKRLTFIERTHIESIQCTRTGLKIKVQDETITLKFRKKQFRQRGEELAKIVAATPTSPATTPSHQGIRALYDMGLIRPAEAILNQLLNTNPDAAFDLDIQEWQEQIKARKFGLRVTAVFFILNALLYLYAPNILLGEFMTEMGVYTTGDLFLPAFIEIMLGIQLWRNRLQGGAQGWVQLRAFLAIFMSFPVALEYGNYLHLIATVCFSIGLMLGLQERPSRLTNFITILLYLLYFYLFAMQGLLTTLTLFANGL